MAVSWCNPCSQFTLDVVQDGNTSCFKCGRDASTPPDIIHPQPLPIMKLRLAPTLTGVSTGPCPCACNSGGFCGGCGHAGCGGRR